MERAAQTFPTLTPAQIERIAAVGRRCSTPAGEILFDVGDQSSRFFVVLSGEIEVVQPAGGVETRIVVHGPGQFTRAEITMISARRSLLRARTTVASELLVVDNGVLRTLVQRDAELSEIFMRAFILRRVQLLDVGAQDLVLVGSRNSADTMRIKEFLTRNAQPFRYQDVETEPGVEAMLEGFRVGVNEIPIVICQGGRILKNPSTDLLAETTGLDPKLDTTVVRDVVVVGAGPAGLATAVYGASEGLDVLVLEGNAPGGQAGTSSRIENYLGFPTGISGQALSGRALTQAQKFGAEVAIGRTAVRLDCHSRPYRIYLSDGQGGSREGGRDRHRREVQEASTFHRSPVSKELASTTVRLDSKGSSAPDRTSPSWAGATRQGKPRSTFLSSRITCRFWCAARGSWKACRSNT